MVTLASVEDLGIELQPFEDMSYGGARLKQAVLKRPQATWSQSIFSCTFEDKVIPNRDYPYQGLHMLVDGQNWKFLDGIAIGIKKAGKYLPLRSGSVLLYPWKAVYRYEGDGFDLKVDYYLLRFEEANGTAARILVTLETSQPVEDLSIDVEPYADIRHMYEPSNPGAHQGAVDDNRLRILRDEKCILIGASNSTPKIREWNESSWWYYKLGSGFREHRDGEIRFRGEGREIVSLGELEFSFKDNKATLLIITCSSSRENAINLYEKASREYEANEKAEQNIAEEVMKKLDLKINSKETSRDVILRALAMLGFGMYSEQVKIPEAGDFWFRNIWFRDVYEGLLGNLKTLHILKKHNDIKNILLYSLNTLNAQGQLPNRISPYGEVDYNSADSTLLMYIVAGEHLKITGDKELAGLILKAARHTFKGYLNAELDMVNGAPVLNQNGLLSASAWHSWTDSRRWHNVDGTSALMPARLSDEFAVKLIRETGKNAEQEASKPKFFLPEINAQWIRTLAAMLEISKLAPARNEALREGCLELLVRAVQSYRETFWRDDRLFNAVTIDGKKDPVMGSPSLVAMALLSDLNVFSEAEINAFMKNVKLELLANRNERPFGVIVKNSGKRVYFDDDQYHEAVVWPRDTPYLTHLLQKTGEFETIKQILISNLEHQMSESAILYNSELFSSENDLIPMKNPVQWWSQWCDPYINFQEIL